MAREAGRSPVESAPGGSMEKDDDGATQPRANEDDGSSRVGRRRWRSSGTTTTMVQRSAPGVEEDGFYGRRAAPFPPYARSMRRLDGQTFIDGAAAEDFVEDRCIDGAVAEDFDEDPWMTVVPYMDRHLDNWSDATWKAMESGCSSASHYKFASMLEFGDLIALPDGVVERKFLNHVRKTVRCISRHCSRLDCEYITSSPRTWGNSGKQELLDWDRHCSFLEQYPLRRLGIRPQTVSYCSMRLSITGCAFARVLCVATTNKNRKLVDAVVRVSRNEVSIVAEGGRPVYTFSPLRYHVDAVVRVFGECNSQGAADPRVWIINECHVRLRFTTSSTGGPARRYIRRGCRTSCLKEKEHELWEACAWQDMADMK
ncbi:hypothetical protein CBR_g21866 [Chara braunii]|uniref:Uncharacterized protein n=1 Tax=Chara braunii TaxID=69332 RepID=A0A388L1E0_CHABU|nr:hypothetical protein CBR_g21866 [Chara braunii]|eukprot:GBG76117.1 hypothetical protein CBR_g21866 [Chara braunii]